MLTMNLFGISLKRDFPSCGVKSSRSLWTNQISPGPDSRWRSVWSTFPRSVVNGSKARLTSRRFEFEQFSDA
jgi:hypothetical protein